MERRSRSSRIVEMALEKARLVHEAYAEYDAKGETPVLSTVLENIKYKFDHLREQNFVNPAASSFSGQIDEQNSDEEYVCSLDCHSRSTSSSDLPLISLVNKIDKPTAAANLSSGHTIEIQNGPTSFADHQLRDSPPHITLLANELITSAIVVTADSVSVDDLRLTNNTLSQIIENEQHSNELPIKKRRLTTAAEKEDRDRKKHPMLQPCLMKCKNKHCSQITDHDRKVIWDAFWKLPYAARRQWLCRNVRICQVKRRTVQPIVRNVSTSSNDENSPPTFLKNESREYFLPKPTLQHKQIKVCKKMLLNTLGYTNDSVLTELSSATKKNAIGEAVGENRGRSAPGNKLNRDVIMNHIETFGPSISHYRRYNAPNCRYLSRDLTIQVMFEDFLSKYPNHCKIETYRSVLKFMNISLKMPKGDRCAECLYYESAIDDAKKLAKPVDSDILIKKGLHELKASQAKTSYNADKTRNQELNERIFSMDLQKVILLPAMPHIKDSFFISRLVVYNETYATLNSSSAYKSVTILWHEALQGRNADSIVDTMFTVMNMDDNVTSFTFWADNCSSQNKNWIIYSSLVHIVNQPTGPQQVTIKYLTKGHTHMSADSVHGNIEKAMRAAGTIDNFDELIRIIQKCRKNLLVEKQEIFREWKSKKRVNHKRESAATNEDEPNISNVLLRDIVEVKFVKGKRELFYKTDFETEDYIQCVFLQKNFAPTKELPPFKKAYRGIHVGKKATIIKDLVPKIKNSNHRAFWLNLPESDQSRDLLNNVDST